MPTLGDQMSRALAIRYAACLSVTALMAVGTSTAWATPIGTSGVQFSLRAVDNRTSPYEKVSADPGSLTFGPATATGDILAPGIPETMAGAAIATYSGSPYDVSAYSTTIFYDDVIFTFAGGGSADIQVLLSGNWATTGTGSISWQLVLGSTQFSGSRTWLSQSATPEFSVNTSPWSDASGTWSFTGNWTVTSGTTYHMYSQLHADAFGSGSSAYIDDPLFFDLPTGVTLQSASGYSYAPAANPTAAPVPEPASLTLFGTGLLAARLLRKRRR